MAVRAGEWGFEREVLLLPRVRSLRGSWEERTGRLLWSTRGRPHHDVFTGRTVGFWSLLFVFVTLNGMDALTTLYGVSRAGWQVEANPVLRFIGLRLGMWGFLFYKALVVGLVVTSLWFMHRGFSRGAQAARSKRMCRAFSFWRIVVEAGALCLVGLFAWAVVNNVAFAFATG